MNDITELPRRIMVNEINSKTQGESKSDTRLRLEADYGQDNVWDTSEVSQIFSIEGFMAPFCVVIRRSDHVKGSVEFTHSPRLYYNFVKA